MHSSMKVRLRFGHWLGHCSTFSLYFFNHFIGDLLLWLGSLSCWWPSLVQASAAGQMGSHLILEYFGTQWSYSQWLQGVPVLYFKKSCAEVDRKCLCWCAVFGILDKQLHFGLLCLKDIIPDDLVFVQMQLCKTKMCSTRLSPAAILVQSVKNFSMLTEACRAWDRARGSFAVSLRITWSDLKTVALY